MKRRTFDRIVSFVGLGLSVLLLVAAGLLNWGAGFANDSVKVQLEQQKNRVLLLFYFITIGIIATLGIVKYLYSKNKTDKIKTTIETENRISKKRICWSKNARNSR